MSVGRSQNTNASLVVTVFSALASAVAPASGSVSSRLRMDDPVSAARRAEAAASPTSPARKIQRVDVALRDHRQLEVRKDTGQLTSFAKAMHGHPLLAAQAEDRCIDRLACQTPLQLLLPGRLRTGELPHTQNPPTPGVRLQNLRPDLLWPLRARKRVLIGEVLMQHIEHGLALQWIGIRRDDGREMHLGTADDRAGRCDRQGPAIGGILMLPSISSRPLRRWQLLRAASAPETDKFPSPWTRPPARHLKRRRFPSSGDGGRIKAAGETRHGSWQGFAG